MSPRFQTTEAGQADLSVLLRYEKPIADLRERLREADTLHGRHSGTLTDRFMDEAQTAGHRPYFIAGAHISGGLEHFDALWKLIVGNDGLSPRAPYSLMRPILEHGFWAQYVLDSDQSVVRRLRGINAEARDRRQRKAWTDVYDLSKESTAAYQRRHEEILGIYRQEAAELGASGLDRTKPDMTVEIPKLRAVSEHGPDVATLCVGAWRLLSGVTHGSLFAVQVMSDIDERHRVERGEEVRVSINDEWFVMSVRASLIMLVDAMRLYIARTTQVNRRVSP